MICDICFHRPLNSNLKDENNIYNYGSDLEENHNPHVHIMLTMRPFNTDKT